MAPAEPPATGDRPPSSQLLRLGAVAVVAAIVGVVVGGGGTYLLVRHFYNTSPTPVVIRDIGGGSGSGGTSLASVLARVEPSLVEVVREQTGHAAPTSADVSNGFVASSSGLIVTSEGAVAGASGVEVVLPSGTLLAATIAAADAGTGVVVLQVDSASLPAPLAFAASAAAGSAAIGVSMVLGGADSVEVGTVSEVGLTDTVADSASASGTAEVDGMMRTDAPQPLGSSGGPLVNASGQVIGILAGPAMEPQDQGAGATAFGFALDATAASSLVGGLAATGSAPTPLGLVTRWLNPASAAALTLPAGAQVLSVAPGSVASSAGLQVGEVVTEVNGSAVDGAAGPGYPDLDDLLAAYGAGNAVAVTVVRAGVSHQLSLTLPSD